MTIKGRTYTDGRKQREWKYKNDSASSTVHADSVMLLIIINALKNRVVSMCNVKGSYLNALLDEFLSIKFEGEQVKIMSKIILNILNM